jgi:Leucine-rich repeat (LRR) protein
LEVISLSDNQLASKGVVILCESLGKCQHLTDLDLSRNRLSDSCADMLTKTLSTNKIEMKHLNLSYNAFTDKCVHYFVQRIATHKSKLQSVDFSHNPDLGDGITAFLSLLLFNKPSHLQRFDVAYSGITDSGVKELSLALPYCTTLVAMNVLGTFSEPLTLQALIESVSKHHKNNSIAGVSGAVIALGGVVQECSESALTVPFKSLKVALPYLSEVTGVQTAVLRRRLLLHSDILNSTGGMSASHQFSKFSCNLNRFSHRSPGDEARHPSAYPLVTLTVQLPTYMESVHEFVEALAIGIKADASQLRVVTSSAVAPATRIFSVTLTVSELSDNRQRILRERNTNAYQQLKSISLLVCERVLTVDDIFIALESLASRSHPLMRRLGVRAVDVQFPAEDGEVIRTQVTLSGASQGGRGLEDHYIPPLSPQDVSQYEGYAAASDTEDDDTFDRALRGADSALDGMEVDDENEEDKEEQEVGVSIRRQSIRRKSLSQQQKQKAVLNEDTALLDGLTREAYISKLAEKRQMRASNERLVLAVRQLYAEGEVTSGVARFWEGAFGHLKHKEVTRQGMLAAIEPVSNVFHAVRKRLLLCNAMFQRDMPVMKTLLEEFRPHAIEGGATFVYAQRLYSELVGLQKRFSDVQHMATDYENLHIVEEYLLACGVLGYAGPEMFLAVELRQSLVALGVSSGNRNVLTDLSHIKYKALLSNLLISREMFSLESKMEDVRRGGEDALQFLSETIATQTMLTEYTTCMSQLDAAIAAKEIEAIDAAVSLAAYHYFYSPVIDSAIVEMNNLARNPARLLGPIVDALRENDLLAVERAFEAVNRMGWRHPALDAVLCSKIYAKKSKIVQDDSIKSKLINLCLAVKNGLTVRAGEMMQLLRRANAIGLEDDADMKPYLMVRELNVPIIC